MTWNDQIDIGDCLAFLGFIVAARSLYFAGRQVYSARIDIEATGRAHRAQFILSLYDIYFRGEDKRRFFYKLDWNTWKFDKNRIARGEEEPWLDQLLYDLDVIGRLVRLGTLQIEDVDIIAFQAYRIINNPEVASYLEWLEKEYQKSKKGLPKPHEDAMFLAQQISKGV